MLSPSKFSFSFDPLHLTWHNVDSPLVWRTDPIVAVVGHRVIVAGGACDFEDDPLAVEMYDLKTRTWDTCESLPAHFKDSAASTWLSMQSQITKFINVMGDFVYISKTSAPEEVVFCEFSDGACRWSSVRNAVVNDQCRLTERLVFTCANVGLGDLQRAIVARIGNSLYFEETESFRDWFGNRNCFRFES
ncbi:hypothetical protein GH714_028089 [Hevea brasiliensis]|uniref:Uncharacterized protein n=1 Tax=Hevea brasiliensis TaxID=3981 RepID=A0A6A6KUW4_HEVBR|nr:hypothetical protein GH714_028089 [Hevea brasiliensis]